jgi:hypothetical protein
VVQDRTDRVMEGSAGVEALDPMQPRKALLAVGEQFLALTREEHTLGKFRSLYGAANAQTLAGRSTGRAPSGSPASWPRTCGARTPRER